jgi:serine protease
MRVFTDALLRRMAVMKKQWINIVVMAGVLALLGAPLLQPPVAWAGGALVQPSPAIRNNATDRLIVKLRNPQTARATTMSVNQVVSLSNAAGVPLTHLRAMSGDAQIMQLSQRMSLAEVEAIARRLSADPQVEYAEPDRIMRPLLVPNDTQYTNQWDLQSAIGGSANLPGAWDITTGSASIVVGVIDTGLAPHADIDSNIMDGSGRVLPGYDFISPDAGGFFYTANDGGGRDSDPSDPGDWITASEDAGTDATGGFFAGCGASNSSWHGTHVAGTIGATGNNGAGVAGINWVSKILPVRVIGKCGGYLSDVVDGARWAAGLPVSGVTTNPNPAKVLNISLGGPGSCSATEQNAIDAIVAAGTVVVVAAGNSNVNLSVSPESPANCNNVISVAALNRTGGRAFYSNYGTTVEIAAPGGDQRVAIADGILSTLNTGATSPVASPGGDTYVYYQGTSMAAPHVAGIVSLMLSVNPALTPALVLSTLQSTARAFPTGTGLDCSTLTCGAGIVNATTAVATAAGLAVVTVSATDAAAAEAGLDPGTFTITRTGATTSPLTVNYTMSGSATNGTDYTAVSGSVVIAASSSTATVTITPIDDSVFEGNETAILTLSTNAAYGVGSPRSATVTIADNEPSVSVSATDTAAAEAGLDPGTFTITRTGATTSPLTVNYTMGGSATNGTDYASVSGSVVIAASSSTATVTITPIDDAVYEGNETAILTLSADAAYGVGTPASATVTIYDNETAPPPASGGGSSGGGGCFIATAAYGTPMTQDVRYLRAFRDQYLQTNDAGRWFVTQYYKFSPPLADYLRQHDDLRAVVRTALSPWVGLSRVVVDDSALAAQTVDRP